MQYVFLFRDYQSDIASPWPKFDVPKTNINKPIFVLGTLNFCGATTSR